jgi:hypothetical protein
MSAVTGERRGAKWKMKVVLASILLMSKRNQEMGDSLQPSFLDNLGFNRES